MKWGHLPSPTMRLIMESKYPSSKTSLQHVAAEINVIDSVCPDVKAQMNEIKDAQSQVNIALRYEV
jgi:hypothetical protein